MPGVTTITTAFPPGGSGTITIVDSTAEAILAQNLILAEILLAQQAAATNLGGCWEKLADIDIKLRNAATRATADAGNMKTILTGMANISNTLQGQATTQKMAYLDQVNNNKFQQATTQASLARGGHPPTVVPPTDIVAEVQKNVQQVTELNVTIATTNLVTNTIQDGIIGAYETSTKWFAQTIVGSWLIEEYAIIQAKVAYIFSSEFIKDAVDAGKRLAASIKAGG
jgi:hypothetical protein